MATSPSRSLLHPPFFLLFAALAPCSVAIASPPDPFLPFPAASGESADPRIEALREALRPEAFKPEHEVVITDALFFRWRGLRGYVKDCGGDPTLTTGLPKEGTPPTPFRASFESPESPIRTYAGHGYACNFPSRFGPADVGFDAPSVQGLISYADGSYWLGDVKGAGNPQSRESVWNAIATHLTPTPSGVGEWGRADGTRLQGEARVVAVPMWPKNWTSASVVGFEMTEIRRAVMPDGRLLAGNLRLEGGNVVSGPSAPTASTVPEATLPEPAVAAVKAFLAANPEAFPAATEAAARPSAAPASSAAPTVVESPAISAPGAVASRPVSVAANEATDARLADLLARVDRWRIALQPENVASARSSIASVGLSKARDYNNHVQACGGGGATLLRLGFANADAQIRSYTGFATGCTFPAQVGEDVFGLITYADGSTWLGQVTASPQAEAIELGTFGGMPAPVHTLVPAPNGVGEWTRADGTRVHGVASPLQAKFMFRDSWTQGPLGAFAMTEVMQLITTEGVAYVGAILLGEGSFSAETATVRWPDGRVFAGSVENSMPRFGTLSYPDGGRITGAVALDTAGVATWEDGAALDLSIATKAGPPGRYRFFAPIRFDTASQGSLEVTGARPIDAATLARAGDNVRQCPEPPVVPAGWVVWWPACELGRFGRVPMYSADAQQALLYYPKGDPKRFVLRKGAEPGAFGGIEIRADDFTRDAMPAPVGEAELYLLGELVFNGSFVAQEPTTGVCVVPADEGGGWEPCEYAGGSRVDMAHELRRERQELARQQEALRREMEQQAEDERYAQEEWEAEQEQAELEEQKRQGEIAGRMAIANAIRGAAYDISTAYLEREAARDAADYRERQAEREAARSSYSPSPSSSSGYGGSSGTANEARAAQLAQQQAELERRQAELRQRQSLASVSRPSSSYSSSSSSASSVAQASGAGGTGSYFFTIADHNVGRVSATRQILGLAVTLEVKRVGLRISGADRSEICANFENGSSASWSGGWRLTDRDANNTHASMTVPAGGTAQKCETLNPQSGYTVVLRQDRS